MSRACGHRTWVSSSGTAPLCSCGHINFSLSIFGTYTLGRAPKLLSALRYRTLQHSDMFNIYWS